MSFISHDYSPSELVTYSFAGELYNSDIDTAFSYSDAGQYPGQHLLSNPYTSAILISEIEFYGNMEKSVYLYNTGTYNQWSENKSTKGSNPGQYIVSTKETAGTAGIPAEIPSMQGFLVVKNVPIEGDEEYVDEGGVSIKHNKVSTPNNTQQRTRQATKTWLRLHLEAKTGAGDVMWIFSSPETTRGNDNGWDGLKMTNPDGTAMLHSANETGMYQINALPDINETEVVFRPNTLDTEYSITFDSENLERDYAGVYLLDKETGQITSIMESGTKYSFQATSQNATSRFRILSNIADNQGDGNNQPKSKVQVFSSGQTVIINNRSSEACRVQIYDQLGRLLAQHYCKENEIKSINTNFSPGSYTVRTIGEEVQSKVVIIVR